MTVLGRRTLACAAVLLLVLGACSDPQGTEPGDAAAPTDPGTASPNGAGEGREKESAAPDGNGGGKGRSAPGSGGTRGGSGKGRGSGDVASGGPFASKRGTPSSFAYPEAGEYVYSQKGWEEFCQGPSCNKEKLPDEQTVTASYTQRSASEATVVTEARSSEQQTLTTTTRYVSDKALITKVVIDFTYGGFTFSQAYDPKPPVESLSFPLEVGKRWSGRWKARTSGDYRMRVVDASDGVYEIETVTNFRGEFSGRAQATIWVDAETRTIVKTDGQVAVASSFGEYSSNFETSLRSGPGY
ncbi:MAG: hypothetical protein M3271_08690 [Actinomycetota bacterium]|nr:hypothetical protein [Actinomycetota bacterium]